MNPPDPPPGFLDQPGEFLPQFCELEAAASAPYCRFTYASDALTRQVQDLLIERGAGEFAPPVGRLYVVDGAPAGLLACLTGEQLQRARLTAAMAVTRARLLDERVARRVQLAATTLLKPGPGDFYLSRIAVHPERRNRGVGAALMEQLFADAARAKALRILLEVAPDTSSAIALYRRYGFEERDRRRVDDPESGLSLEYVHMECAL